MKISKICLDLIKQFEGYHQKLPNGNCTAYLCPSNISTIGYGTTTYSNGIKVKIGDVITHKQAEEELLHFIKKYSDYVKKVVKVPLNQNQFDSLVSFTYNIGIGAFSHSTLLKLLNKGDHKGAGKEILKWTKDSNGQDLPGLIRRRQFEFTLFNS